MKTYKNIYKQIYAYDNLYKAYRKARLGKSKKDYVIIFEKNLEANLISLHRDLAFKTYHPVKLKRFIVRDPKTRVIHSSIFRDRIVHHAIINVIQPIYEKIFIYDSFASRKNKGSHNAVSRFEYFVKKMSKGKLIKDSYNNNSIVGYCLKADVRKYFAKINHEVLINILRKKIDDEDFIDLIKLILENYEETGVPLGNYTSQFFGNVYLNYLDYFVKHRLKAEFYIRYVDDFIILHRDKKVLEEYKSKIEKYLTFLKLELHPDKTEIHALRNGITFLGYRIFYHYKLLTKRNIRHFTKRLKNNIILFNNGEITREQLESRVNGWFGYAKFGNTFKLREKFLSMLPSIKNTETKDLYRLG
jgi:retron-type reverse transcriptase